MSYIIYRTMMNINGSRIVDENGRVLMLRGCNLGGSSKLPLTGKPFSSAGAVFAGRPFPLEEAEQRFVELARWGFNFVRLIITWEALEHEGPGIYDESYLAYLRKLLIEAEKQGVSVFIDPHQDVWSRFTGGDGAPSWTLEKLGMDPAALAAAGAALPVSSGRGPEKALPMIWPTGYNRYAAASMFTLFFGGNVFAPETRIDGESAQDWLQSRYIEAVAHCRRRLKNCKALTGWGTMNEPHQGFIGCRDLKGLGHFLVASGPMPSPLAAMAAASGHTVEIPVYSTGILGVRKTGRTFLNPGGVSVFKDGYSCPWKQAGVWTDEGGRAGTDGKTRGGIGFHKWKPELLKPDHFALYRGRPVRFAEDLLKPFMDRLIQRLSEKDEKTLFFIEGVPEGINAGEAPFVPRESETEPENNPLKDNPGAAPPTRLIHAFHCYDGPTLYTKQFRPWFSFDAEKRRIVIGEKNVAALFRKQLARLSGRARKPGGQNSGAPIPCILGEFGLPFDLFSGRAFKTGDYSVHEKALSMYYDAIDANLLGSTIWNYTADNTNA
ncbi:MAG: glycoside hydrolase family 5 protein, partial [Treponema sp.]|nr:glycoside hydrolase family 5 protein [Treponema sp.]